MGLDCLVSPRPSVVQSEQSARDQRDHTGADRRFQRLSIYRAPSIFHKRNSHVPGHEAAPNRSPLPNYRPSSPQHEQTPASALMSHSNFTDSMSSNFQLIINDALKAYEQHTKKDLLAHPLASQLQACDSPTAILNVLQQQIQGVDQSRNSNDRWTKWLDPTVNILYALCDTLGEGVGLVSPKT